jgi:hypothetical protein
MVQKQRSKKPAKTKKTRKSKITAKRKKTIRAGNVKKKTTRKTVNMDKWNPQEMGKCVNFWLEYQILCNRKMLLSESYLAQPIGEYLRTIFSGEIEAEWNYPNIEREGARQGRPRQVDYALFGKNKNNPLTAIEAKWITENSRKEKQRFVDDILRLECIRSTTSTMTRYFIIAGIAKDIDGFLADDMNKGNGRINFISKFLPVKTTILRPVNFEVENCPDYCRRFFKTFYNDYKIDLPKKYQAALVYDGEEGGNIRVLIWKIQSVSKRSSFKPEEDKWRKVPTIDTDQDVALLDT